MNYKNCTCNPPAVMSSIFGERCHIEDERGEWCAITNEKGIYLQVLLIPSEQELIKEQVHQEAVFIEQAAQLVKEARTQELKMKMNSGEILSNQELNELLSTII